MSSIIEKALGIGIAAALTFGGASSCGREKDQSSPTEPPRPPTAAASPRPQESPTAEILSPQEVVNEFLRNTIRPKILPANIPVLNRVDINPQSSLFPDFVQYQVVFVGRDGNPINVVYYATRSGGSLFKQDGLPAKIIISYLTNAFDEQALTEETLNSSLNRVFNPPPTALSSFRGFTVNGNPAFEASSAPGPNGIKETRGGTYQMSTVNVLGYSVVRSGALMACAIYPSSPEYNDGRCIAPPPRD